MTKVVKKKVQAYQQFQEHLDLFRCPICQGDLLASDLSRFYCTSNHNFDLARNGYLNLLTTQQKKQYDKNLFRARREIFKLGVYDLLIASVITLINELNLENPRVLDAGCGEGSFLAKLQTKLSTATLVGIDISRSGVRLAGGHDCPVMWCVADLAQLPLKTSSMDVVLNILSPANYGEFNRVLKPDGVVIKVLPGEDYLLELRQRLVGVPPYSNEEVLANFEENLKIQSKERLHYQIPIDLLLWTLLVEMTPLTQHRRILGNPSEQITIDLEVIRGSFL